ncbi:ABC transporter ATP-binding protein [Rhodobacteraceae bacterium]|nr:ABC transporter ATP-binding protein [Paracoccaceae bacterium]
MSLVAEHLTIAYHATRAPVLDDLSLTIPKGAVTAIIGPNGCGKSTLLRGLCGLIAKRTGRVVLEGEDIARMRPAHLARKLALLPQAPTAPDGIRVEELVARGRTPWLRPFRPLSHADRTAVAAAMAATGVQEMHDRRVADLSGGQRQRVWIAMSLAQGTGWQMLDEPTTWLDLPHQLEVLQLVRHLNRDQGRSIVMSLHDISLAARFADHVIALRAGRLVAAGPVADVITAPMLAEIFGLRAQVIADPLHGTPLVLPY